MFQTSFLQKISGTSSCVSICLYNVLVDFSGIASKSYEKWISTKRLENKNKMHLLNQFANKWVFSLVVLSPRKGSGILFSGSTLAIQGNGENTNKIS